MSASSFSVPFPKFQLCVSLALVPCAKLLGYKGHFKNDANILDIIYGTAKLKMFAELFCVRMSSRLVVGVRGGWRAEGWGWGVIVCWCPWICWSMEETTMLNWKSVYEYVVILFDLWRFRVGEQSEGAFTINDVILWFHVNYLCIHFAIASVLWCV